MTYPTAVIDPTRRHDFMLVFDVIDGNPNGDPDNGNLPRVDPETMQGIVTDVAIKRKVRDYVALTRETDEKRRIYVKHRGILVNENRLAYEACGYKKEPERKKKGQAQKEAKAWMCQHYYDIRLFGAVMSSTNFNAGQVRGPIQLTFARSLDRITPLDITITRVALTNATDVTIGSADDTEAASSQMGRKPFVPYGLYVAYGFFSPAFAERTGVDDQDLALFWEALERMWEYDRSASRGRMACRGLYVFTHENPRGNAPTHRLFDAIKIKKKEEVKVPRQFDDYLISTPEELPEGVTLHVLVG
jgi:CRISPR-associated protein Csd2